MPSFIINTTFNCNVECKHCGAKGLFYKYGKSFLKISDGLKAIEKCLQFYDDLQKTNLIFHGGEPLILGTEYYEEFINKFYKLYRERSVHISFQTNLTLYSKKWKNFFKKYGIKVSSSYDFYADFRRFNDNDVNRYYKIWEGKVKQLQDDLGDTILVIVVMSKLNKDYVKEIVQRAKELEVHLKLNPLRNVGKATMFYKDIALSPEEYGKILIDVYRWSKEYGVFEEHSFIFETSINTGSLNLLHTKCPYSGNCVGHIWAITPDGSIFNCGEDLQSGGKYYLGNYLDGIDQNRFISAKSKDMYISEECYLCGICGGGCKYCRHNGKYYWCETIKLFYNYIKFEQKTTIKV